MKVKGQNTVSGNSSDGSSSSIVSLHGKCPNLENKYSSNEDADDIKYGEKQA